MSELLDLARKEYADLVARGDMQFRKRIFGGKCDDCLWIQGRMIALRAQQKDSGNG